MSKFNKKNKKSKKNNRKNYKIEPLEPRLLMDAAPNANDWIKEADAANMDIGVYTVSASSSEMDGVLVENSNPDKEPEKLSLASVINGQKIDYESAVDDVKDYVKERVNYLRDKATESLLKEMENKATARDNAQYAFVHASQSDLLAHPEIADNFIKAQLEYDAAKALYQNAYDNFSVDADTLLLELSSPSDPNAAVPAGCTFSLDVSDPQKHKIKVQIERNFTLKSLGSKGLTPDIAEQTNIGARFKDFDMSKDASGRAVINFVLDANDKTGPDDFASIEARFNFYQKCADQEGKKGNIGVLDLTSIEDVKSTDPDLTVIGAYRSDTKKIITNYKYDLDFEVSDFASVASSMYNFNVDDPAHLKYVGDTVVGQAPMWQDAAGSSANDENAFVPLFANVQIGDILKQFNAISKWLQQKVENEYLKHDFGRMINQNASSFLRLSHYFDSVLRTPPQSIQELIQRYSNGVIQVTFNNDVCELAFSGGYASSIEADASLNGDGFFRELSESMDVVSRDSLKLKVDSYLDLCLSIPMNPDGYASENTNISAIGIDQQNHGLMIGATEVVVSDIELPLQTTLAGDIGFSLYVNGIEKGKSSLSAGYLLDASGIDGVCGKLNTIYGSNVFTSVYDQSRYMLVADISAPEVKTLSVSVKNGDGRWIGFNGPQQFSRAYVLDESSTLKISGTEVKKAKNGDYLVAINNFLMSNAQYADYSAIRIKDSVAGNNKIVIIYSPSETVDYGTTAPETDLLGKFTGGKECWVLVSALLPVELPASDVVVSVKTNAGTTTSETIAAEKFDSCYTAEDVARVLNLAVKSLGIEACVRGQKIGFFATNSAVEEISCSEFGFLGTMQTPAALCLELNFSGISPISIDLHDLFSQKQDPSIAQILDEIKDQCVAQNNSISITRDGLSLKVKNATLESIKNINGYSLVEMLGLVVDGNTISVRVKNQKQVGIKSLGISVTEELTGPSHLASAQIGAVGLDIGIDSVSDSVGIKASASEVFLHSGSGVTDISSIKLQPTWNYSSTGTNHLAVRNKGGMEKTVPGTKICDVYILGTNDEGKIVPKVVVSGDDLLQEDVRLFGKNDAQNTNRLELSISDVVDKVAEALKDGVLKNLLKYGEMTDDELDAIPKDSVLDVLNQQLPLFGKSAPELLGLINKLNDVLDNITKNHPATLQELCQRVYNALGANLYFEINEGSIDFTLFWKNTYKSQRVGINDFAILDGVNVGGSAEVYLNGSIEAQFDFTISTDGSALGTPELKEGSKIDVDVTLIGKPLSFDLTLNVGGMTPPLMKVVSSDANPSYIAIKIKENFVYGKSTEDVESDEDEPDTEEVELAWKHDDDACQIGGKLRVECAGLDVGEIVLGVVNSAGVVNAWSGAGSGGNFTMADIVNGKVGVRIPEDFDGEVDVGENDTVGSVVLDFSGINTNWKKFDLFGQVRLVADALSTALRKAQSSLNKTFLSDGMRKIPLVGDSIVGAADCLTALDEAFIEPFRKFAYNSQNLDAAVVAERLYTILQKTGLLRALDKKVLLDAQNNCTQKVLWAGAEFDRFFEDNGSQYIQYRNNGDCVEWRFRLGDTYMLSGNADFDLGMPGLGLSSKGGVGLELSWDWYIGFGVSKTGAYIMLSKGDDVDSTRTEGNKTIQIVADGITRKVKAEGTGVEQNLLSGDDIRVSMNVLKLGDLGLNGSLGFLKMGATVGSGSAFNKDANGNFILSELTFGIDLNDGKNGSKDHDEDNESDKKSASTKINTDNIASALSLETNLNGHLDINIVMDLGFGSDKIDIGFPNIGTTFHLKWSAAFDQPFGSLEEAGFNGIYLDLGSFVNRTLKPVLNKIQKVLDPIMPLIDFLQSEIPVLSSLPKGGSKMTVLNLIKSIGSAKGLNLGMIDDIVKVANLVKNVDSLVTTLKNPIPIGSLNLFSGLSTDKDVSSFLSGTSGLPLGDFAGRLTGGDSNEAANAAKSFSDKFGTQSTAPNGRNYGWLFPLFQNEKTGVFDFNTLKASAISLLFGQDVKLVEYRMQPLIFDFDWSKSFPIVGPLCADIGLNFGAQIELCFGYDTHGLISWKKTGFKDLWALADGFYINDLDGNGKDISEVIFYSGITAGASVAGRAGINVGVNLNLNLNLDDPNNDGKLRLSELADSLAHSPFAIFDASVTLQARAYAYLDLVFYRKEFDLWKSGALELFNTDKSGTGTPVVATTQEGNLVVNVGEFAEKRVYGNLDDGDDDITVTCDGNNVKINIANRGVASYTLAAGKSVYIYAKDGKDKVTITGKSSLNFVIDGGNGNDEIDLSGLTLLPNCYALVMGGLGDDFIRGADIGTNILLGETADVLYKKKKSSDEEYVALVNAYPNSSNPGNNVIVGGRGKNYIVGGGGSDLIVGGVDAKFDNKDADGNVTGTVYVTENHLYGDFAYFEFDELLSLTKARNEDLYDEGGNDVIFGSSRKDEIFGGAGSDRIKGGDGDDEIHGGKGNDIIYGGAGNDRIFGEDGVDVIFGDTPANDAMVIAREDDAVGELPYVYIAEEIKKDTSDLFGSDTVTTTDADGNVSSESVNRIALFNFENSFKTDVDSLNARAQEAVKLFDAPQIDLGATQTAATTGATATGTTAATGAEGTEPQVEEDASTQVTNGSDVIEGGNGSDIIFGDDGLNTSDGGSDKIAGGAGNDFIDGDGGNDTINGDYGEDIIYGGAGNDTLDGGAGNDFVFGDNGLAGYVKDNNGAIVGSSELFKNSFDGSDDDKIAKANQDLMFGYGMTAFAQNFGIKADAKSSNADGNDTILAGNGSDFVDGQSGDDTYKIQVMGGSNHAITNVMDSGTADKGDSMTIDGTVEADDMLVRASTAGLGFVAKLPSKEDAQIERINFWNVGGGDTGLENVALNTGAGNDKIAIDGTLSTITIDAGAGNDSITVGQQFESERNTDKDHSNVLPNDAFTTTKTTQGYLSAGVQHSTNIEGGEGNDTFNVLRNTAAVSLSGGLGNDTFNVAMFQEDKGNGQKSIVENGPVTLIGGAGLDKMSIAGSDGDDDFVISQGRILSNGIDVQSVSIENRNVYGGDGDDSFYVLDTDEKEVTKLYGNKGNDSFYNGGVGTAKEPENIGNSKNDDSNAIGVLFYNENAANYDDVDNRIDTAKNSLDEGSAAKTVYKIALSKQPEDNEVVSVTIFAPGETTEKLNRGDRGIWLVDAEGKYCKSITYKFAKTAGTGVFAWNALVDVKLVAIGDSVREGNDYFSLLHNVSSTQTNAKIKDCKNALVFLEGMSDASSFVQQQYHVVNATESASGSIALSLIETPITGSIECWYEKGSVRQAISTFAVNNSNLTISVSPAALETNGYIFVKYKVAGDANKVQNMFAITQEHVLASQEIDESKILWYLQALPEKQNIDCWYMKDGSPVQVPETCLDRNSSNNELTIDLNKMGSIPAVGTRFYISYKFEHMLVVNESAIQMSNSTEGMTELLAFVPVDEVNGGYVNESYLICAESEIRNYPQCRYCYRTAGTQLIICSVRPDGTAGQPVPMYGNIAFAWQSLDSENGEKHYPFVVIEDEKDSFENVSPADVMKNIAQNTIENIKGALYEDGMGREADLGIDGPMMLHYSGEKTKPTDNDEKNVASAADQSARNAAKAEAAKFDEGNSKDRVFVNNQNNPKAGAQNDLKALSKVATFDNNLISKNTNSAAVLQKTEDVVKQADTEWHDSDKHALRLDHKDAGADSANQFNLANMEYAEINLGQGVDQVDVHKTVYREDGFQTFTVVNSGKGGDTVNVHSYAEEKSDKIATLKNLSATNYNGSIKNVVAYNVSGLTFCEGKSAATLTSIKNSNATAEENGLIDRNRVFLNVEFSDGTVQRREVVLDAYDVTKMLLLKRELTPVADGVSIVSMYLANGYMGDGLLVVNAQSGNDTINAMGDNDADGKSKVTREGMVVIGGTGNDTLKVNTNVIAFGDRGQVIYENEKGEVVTRLGSLDVDSSITKDDVLDQYDYTTPSAKTQKVNGQDVSVTNYFQTDGVVRDPKYIHSVSEKVGGTDTIIANGDRNVVFGGAGADTIRLNGSDNVAVGDNGEAKFANSDVVKNASGDVVNHVYGDSTKTYLNYVQSTFDAEGDTDTITTKDGKNVVIGGTASDKIATGNGNDIIVGDGGEAYVDRNREALFVSNQGRNLDGSAGSDVIKTSGGDNVILGGLNSQSRDFDFVKNEQSGEWETTSVDENNEDLIVSGSGKDVVFGDNAYATFKGNSSMANGMENMPTVYEESTLSFNFQGPAQTGIAANEQAGAVADYTVKNVDETTGETVETTEHADYRVGNWNNIKGRFGLEAGTYGNDDNEIVLFDNGTRASAVSVTYGATEEHRINTSDGENIRLHGYDQTPYVTGDDSGDKNLMKSGVEITGNNGRNTLIAQVDGLSQYFTDYDVVVYLDMVSENSMPYDSVRVVRLYIDSVDENGEYKRSFFDEFYVNDPENNTFDGSWTVAEGKSVSTATVANCVVFRSFTDKDGVLHTITGDRFHVEITDPLNGSNGKDRAGIAGIQVRGRHHKQDIAASTDVSHGGKDVVDTNGGDDIVVGGTGNDTIKTFGDDRYGIRDNDVVYGDNAKMVFTDRDGDAATATTISHAESVAVEDTKNATYNDTIDTGDGNDVVVGGVGHDVINSGATADAVTKADGITVVSYNFVTESTNESLLINPGESAGVVVDNAWHNVYLRNHEARDRSLGIEEDLAEGAITFDYVSINRNGNNNNLNEQVDPAMGADSANNKMLKTLVMGQRDEVLSLTLHNLPGTPSAPCDLYVYVGGKLGNSDGYDYVFKIDGSVNGSVDQTFYLNDWMGNSFEGEFKQVTCKKYVAGKVASGITPNVEMIGNYVVFRNVSTSDYTVQISCIDSTLGTAHPNDIPVFTAVQVVTGANRRGDIALGGDHDKDLVFGDDASLDFDLDIPFAGDEKVGEYKNRVITAESMALSADEVRDQRTDDEIVTGKDRDVVVGGEGGDIIHTGDGDDVAIGDNARLMVENNNPIGVFLPDVEVVLEDHQYFDAEKEAYLDHDNVDEQRMMQKFNDGKVVGIELLESENGRRDVIDVGAGENLSFEQNASDAPLYTGSQQGQSGEGEQGGNGNENQNSENGSENGNESGNGSENQGGETTVTTVESYLMETPLHLTAGETVKVVFHEYFRDSNYVPNLKLIFNGSEGQFAAIEVDLDTASGPLHYDIPSTWWYAVDVPDQPNGENGCFVVYFKAEEDTVITVSVAQ